MKRLTTDTNKCMNEIYGMKWMNEIKPTIGDNYTSMKKIMYALYTTKH